MKKRLLVSLYLVLGVLGWILTFVSYNRPNKLSANITTSYIQSSSWHQVKGTISELGTLLEQNSISDSPGFQRKVKNVLNHQMFIFINDVNSIPSEVINVGDLYYRRFNKDKYFEDVYAIIISNQDSFKKLILISEITEFYQNEAIKSLRLN